MKKIGIAELRMSSFTWDEWKEHGYVVNKGERHRGRNDYNLPTYDFDQVVKINKPLMGRCKVIISDTGYFAEVAKPNAKPSPEHHVLCRCATVADAETVVSGINALRRSLSW